MGTFVVPFRSSRVLLAQLGVLVAAAVAVAATSSRAAWAHPDVLAALAVLVVGGRQVPITVRGVHLSTSLAGLTLTMALAGPAPAAVLACLAVTLDALHLRPQPARILAELVSAVVVCLAGGLVLIATGVAGTPHGTADLAAISLVHLGVTILTSFLTAEQLRLHSRDAPPVRDALRTALVRVAPWQLGGAAACAAALALDARSGAPALQLAVIALLSLQLLGRAALTAVQGREKLASRLAELERLHEGLLSTTLRALALRDPSTARHSAAVARYARALAAQVGHAEVEQDLVHTAALVHDIGKLSFQDAVLAARMPLTGEQRAHVLRHPADGAQILRSVAGFEDVARIVHDHHERWDGRGYPRGLRGEEIHPLARVLAVAEAYDTMTAEDSYRPRKGHDEAMAQLRQAAGTQFEPRLVDAFEALAEQGAVAFGRHDRDVEHQLRLPRSAWA